MKKRNKKVTAIKITLTTLGIIAAGFVTYTIILVNTTKDFFSYLNNEE